jgi:hypothetical protein
VNTLVSTSDLLEFGTFSDALLDSAVADIRAEAGWHIAPRLVETVRVRVPRVASWRRGRGGELLLPTRDLPGAPVDVRTVRAGSTVLAGWAADGETLSLSYVWARPLTHLDVELEHGFPVCPPDLLPLIAQRAQAARAPRDSRVTSFTNGGVQMSFGASAYSIDPKVDRYRVLGGVA